MGEFYQDGDGVNVDMQKAVHYYQVRAITYFAYQA
jgi:TPR repeat protein